MQDNHGDISPGTASLVAQQAPLRGSADGAAAPSFPAGLGRLLRDSAVYGLGVVLQPLLAFLMLPVYTAFIRPGDYGVLELLNRAQEFVAVGFSLGVAHGAVRLYADRYLWPDKNRVVSTALVFATLWGLLLAALLVPFSALWSRTIIGPGAYHVLFVAIILTAWLDTCVRVPLSYLRSREQSARYTAINVARLVAGVALNVFFLVFLRMGMAGIIWAALIVAGASCLVLAPVMIRQTGLAFSREDLAGVLRFGIPLAVAGIPVLVLHYADRFVMARYCTADVIGTYSVGYRIGMMVGVFVNTPFSLAYEPYAYALQRRSDSTRIYSRVLTYHGIAALFAFVSLAALGPEIVRLMAARDYFPAHRVIPWVGLGYVFYGLSSTARLGLMLRKRTELTLPLDTAGAAVSLALTFLLVPRFGMIGAAAATLFSFLLLAIASYLVASRVYPIPYELARLARAFIVSLGVMAALLYLCPQQPALRLLSEGIAIVAFPPLLVVSGVFTPDEITMLHRTLRSWRASLRPRLGKP